MSIKNNFKTYLFSIIGVALAIIGFIALSFISTSRTNSLSQLESNKIQIQNKIDQLSVQNKTKIKKIKSQVTGINLG